MMWTPMVRAIMDVQSFKSSEDDGQCETYAMHVLEMRLRHKMSWSNCDYFSYPHIKIKNSY